MEKIMSKEMEQNDERAMRIIHKKAMAYDLLIELDSHPEKKVYSTSEIQDLIHSYIDKAEKEL